LLTHGPHFKSTGTGAYVRRHLAAGSQLSTFPVQYNSPLYAQNLTSSATLLRPLYTQRLGSHMLKNHSRRSCERSVQGLMPIEGTSRMPLTEAPRICLLIEVFNTPSIRRRRRVYRNIHTINKYWGKCPITATKHPCRMIHQN
jgi:hypothetical protein